MLFTRKIKINIYICTTIAYTVSENSKHASIKYSGIFVVFPKGFSLFHVSLHKINKFLFHNTFSRYCCRLIIYFIR